jgi:hypothetical protein
MPIRPKLAYTMLFAPLMHFVCADPDAAWAVIIQSFVRIVIALHYRVNVRIATIIGFYGVCSPVPVLIVD